MKLIRCTKALRFKEVDRLTEYQLLRDFSPSSIRFNIAFMSMQINEMYYLSVSTTTPTPIGLVSVGCNVDRLAIWIIEQKQALERYKKKSNSNMHLLKRCLYTYSKDEQREVKSYLSSNGRYGNTDIIDRLRYDLYQHTNNERLKRNKARNDARLLNIYKHKRYRYRPDV
ncbi:spore coat protein [Macrococcoides goetzii]|uniref:spore coat protein n=1 Tax=Macrococcus sp. PK TaxID=2801919 RepID=UPI001F0E7333|nr:spore coat protein [Macrococcus sp. PK]MCH4984922.1 spore coat protein [Macrococcus sp. PK]